MTPPFLVASGRLDQHRTGRRGQDRRRSGEDREIDRRVVDGIGNVEVRQIDRVRRLVQDLDPFPARVGASGLISSSVMTRSPATGSGAMASMGSIGGAAPPPRPPPPSGPGDPAAPRGPAPPAPALTPAPSDSLIPPAPPVTAGPPVALVPPLPSPSEPRPPIRSPAPPWPASPRVASAAPASTVDGMVRRRRKISASPLPRTARPEEHPIDSCVGGSSP